VIYAIRAVGTEFVKIGYCKDADASARIATLQTGCPHVLKLAAFGPGDVSLEKRYHKLLKRAGAHERGEWYRNGKAVEMLVWHIRASSEPKTLPQKAIAYELPAYDSTRSRLGRILEYAKRTAGHAADSPASPTGAAQALQPNSSPA
jgi:hypothetical protein